MAHLSIRSFALSSQDIITLQLVALVLGQVHIFIGLVHSLMPQQPLYSELVTTSFNEVSPSAVSAAMWVPSAFGDTNLLAKELIDSSEASCG